MRGLKGKTVIITGGSSGIGKACMKRLCEEGCNVTFSGISANGEITEKEFIQAGYNVHFVRGDMGEESTCQQIVEETIKKWGKLNFLVNNAFPFTAKGIDAERIDWVNTMNRGPIAYATMTQCVLPHMKEQGGAIINMSSVSGHIAQPKRWTYNAAKGAVIQLNRCMAMDLAPFNIRVNIVSPGWIWTREVEKAANGDCEKWGKIWGDYHLMRRLGEVDEVAAAVAFLLSDDASFITGVDLPVDGGYLAMGSEGLGDTSSFAGSN